MSNEAGKYFDVSGVPVSIIYRVEAVLEMTAAFFSA